MLSLVFYSLERKRVCNVGHDITRFRKDFLMVFQNLFGKSLQDPLMVQSLKRGHAFEWRPFEAALQKTDEILRNTYSFIDFLEVILLSPRFSVSTFVRHL